MRPKIVVLTPIKNEAWILPRFLSVWSQVADHIIIADQASSDDSRTICNRFPKVALIENGSNQFNEAERQVLLIDAARRLVPGPRIIIAPDADEILSANATSTAEWQQMLTAAPGTVIKIEKPDLIGDVRHCLRFEKMRWPMAYVDDGAPHNPTYIHSSRIPCPPNNPQLVFEDIKILHYNLVRPRALRAKRRMYCVIEALKGTKPLWRRWISYDRHIDWSKQGEVTTTPAAWLEGWEQMGIDLQTIEETPPFWQDLEVLRLFAEHGTQRIMWDDLWDVDWEAMRLEALRTDPNLALPSKPIRIPPPFVRVCADGGKALVKALVASKRQISRP